MSQKVERYEGRKPVYAPEGPASATSSGPLVAIGTVRAPAYYGDVAEALTGGAGPVERRQATPDEMAAARAREVEPRHLTTDNSRTVQRGAERHVEVLAARRPSPELELPPEESVMPEPKPLDTFEALAEAAAQASEAWAHRQAAQMAWEIAQEALEAALGEVDAILHPPVALPILVATAAADELAPAAEPTEPQAAERLVVDVAATVAAVKARREPKPIGAGQAKRPYTRPRVAELPLTDRQEKLLAATVRLRGDRKAVAAEFGLKAHQTVDVVLAIAGKKGRLPASLIPLLPARFAKYSGV